MAQPLFNSPALTAGEPTVKSSAPVAVGGKRQPISGSRRLKPKKVKVRHTHKPHRGAGTVQVTDPFKAAIDAAIQLKFGPQEQAINQQVNNARYGQMRAAHWFEDYQNMLGQRIAAQNQAAQNVAAALGQYNPQAAQTGNPQADALAQQAQQSQKFLGQSFAGTQGQLSLNAANQLSGLGAGANLQNQITQQGLGNQIGQLLQQRGQVQSDKGAYATNLRGQLESAAQKAQNDLAKTQLAAQALNIKLDTLNNVQKPLAQSLIGDRSAKQKVSRTNARTQRGNLAERRQQDRVGNQLKVNRLALDAYMKAHPELSGKSKGGKFTSTQVRNNQKKFRTVLGSMDPNAVKKNPEKAIEALVRGRNVDPLLARAVVQTVAGGGVDRKTATAYYRAYGHHLKVNDLGEKTVGGVIKFFQGQ